MTTNTRTYNSWKNKIVSFSLLMLALCAQAGFQYASSNGRDLLLGFRKTGGSFELVINAGSVSNFYNLPIGTTITVTYVTAAQLGAAFSDLNDVSWSAMADVRATGDASYPYSTVWVTRARASLSTQSTPWIRKSQYNQGTTAGKISGLGDNMTLYANNQPSDANNTTFGIVAPAGDATYDYSPYIGASGDFVGTFRGNTECTTPSTFTTDGQPVRSDLYQVLPSSSDLPGVYLGYFEFNTNGVLTYKSGPSAATLTAPNIVSITRDGNSSTITFTTGAGGQYSLRYTNSAGLTSPISTWATSGSPVTGDGSNKSLGDSTSDDTRVYAISATP